MPSAFTWSTLALAGGLLLAAQKTPRKEEKKEWKAGYDYTNLQPTDEEYFAPLAPAPSSFRIALARVQASGKAPVRLLRAALRPGPDGKVAWLFETFEGEPAGEPRRVDLVVAVQGGEILERTELAALTPADAQAWKDMLAAKVGVDDALEAAFRGVWGEKDTAMMPDPEVRYLRFVSTVGLPRWELELMGYDRAHKLRRYEITVPPQRAICRTVILQDRFAGEPLRKNEPRIHESGLMVYDFAVGDGPIVTPRSTVRIHYRAFLLDNTKVFDTIKMKRPETWVASAVPIRGVAEGIIGMRAGGRRKIVIPYEKAFGEAGNAFAPPRAMVTFDVTMLDVGLE
jgi:hypothetical protein